MADRLVCRDCHRVLEVDDGEQCPACGSNSLTEDWAGYVVIAQSSVREFDPQDGHCAPSSTSSTRWQSRHTSRSAI